MSNFPDFSSHGYQVNIIFLHALAFLLIAFGGVSGFVIGFAIAIAIFGDMLEVVLQTPTLIGLAIGAAMGLLVGLEFGQTGAGIDSKTKTKALEKLGNVASTVGALLGVSDLRKNSPKLLFLRVLCASAVDFFIILRKSYSKYLIFNSSACTTLPLPHSTLCSQRLC